MFKYIVKNTNGNARRQDVHYRVINVYLLI